MIISHFSLLFGVHLFFRCSTHKQAEKHICLKKKKTTHIKTIEAAHFIKYNINSDTVNHIMNLVKRTRESIIIMI